MSNFNSSSNQYPQGDQFSASAFVSQNYYSQQNNNNSSPTTSQFGSNSGSYSNNTPARSQQQQQSASLNSQNQLWMGDLDPWWDENAIKQIWASVGETSTLSQIKLIYNRNIQANQTGNAANSGYCFITFNSYQATQQALSHNGTAIPGTNRLFKLNWASAGAQQQQAQISQQQQQQQVAPGQEFSIFVGDLAPDVSDKLLFDFFQSQYPSCSSAKIVIDQVTGNSRGYGFVKFTNELEQNQALLEMQSAILNGRPIRVSTATKNTQARSGGLNTGPGGATGLLQAQPKIVIPPQQFNPQLSPFSDSNNTTVFIGGLNVPISAEELRAYFQVYGDIVYAKVLDGKNCGFVQYVNRVDAEKAMIEMQGFPIGTSRMRLAWGQKYSQQQQQQQQQAQQLQVPQQQQQQQQQQGSLYSSLMNHSYGSQSNGFIDQHTYVNRSFDQNSFDNNSSIVGRTADAAMLSQTDRDTPAYLSQDPWFLQQYRLAKPNGFN